MAGLAAVLAAECAPFFLQHPRVAIVGGPRTGKTTLSQSVTDRLVLHSDDLIPLGWSEASEQLAIRANAHPGPLVVEGVAVPRALRKGMRVDAVVVLERAHVPLTPGQVTMAKGVSTVFAEWSAANQTIPVYRPDYRWVTVQDPTPRHTW